MIDKWGEYDEIPYPEFSRSLAETHAALIRIALTCGDSQLLARAYRIAGQTPRRVAKSTRPLTIGKRREQRALELIDEYGELTARKWIELDNLPRKAATNALERLCLEHVVTRRVVGQTYVYTRRVQHDR